MEDMTGLDLALLIPPFLEPRAPLTPAARGHWSLPQPSEHFRPTGKYPEKREWRCECCMSVCVGWICLAGFRVEVLREGFRQTCSGRSNGCRDPEKWDACWVVCEVCREAHGACLKGMRDCMSGVNRNVVLRKAHLVNGAHLKTIMAG